MATFRSNTPAPPPPGEGGAYYAAPPEPPKKKRRWPWIVGGLLAFFVLVGSCGGDDPEPTSAPAPAPTAEATVEETTEAEETTPEPSPEPTTEEPEETTTPEPEVTEEVEEAAEEVEEDVTLDRETELMLLDVVIESTFSPGSSDMEDICYGWDLAPDMMMDAFMAEFRIEDMGTTTLTERDVESRVSRHLDQTCG